MPHKDDFLGPASLEEDDHKKKKTKKQKAQEKQKAQSKSSGGTEAATGVGAGIATAVAGPIAGAAVGLAGSAIDRNQQAKAVGKDPNRPKRRKLAKGVEAFHDAKKRRQTAMAALSQATFDFASNLR